MGKKHKKFKAGIATQYLSRSQAVKRLQLTLRDFRRLCILKGIYPREPKNIKKANSGKTTNKTFYFTRDIQFLSHEPIIEKFRNLKTHLRKVTRAKAQQDPESIKRLAQQKPHYKLDHIVRERYPTFKDALRDMDDCLSMCFHFATFPNIAGVPSKFIQKCRRLITEFQLYIIHARALRKVFVSIKGIYFQADVMGETVCWIVPHKIPFQPPSEVDFKVMLTFLEFYVTLLNFMNVKLYANINLHYPPKLMFEDDTSKLDDRDIVEPQENIKERVYSLNQILLPAAVGTAAAAADLAAAGGDSAAVALDEFSSEQLGYSEKTEKARAEQQSLLTLQSLFTNRKLFLNREVPREALTFVIRACGGSEVSWDRTSGVGATFTESDPSITHQIIDRPLASDKLKVDRVYVQPQWIFDCVNARQLLPVQSYLPDAVLPPHLSPFIDSSEAEYISHEELMRRYDEERAEEAGDVVADDDDSPSKVAPKERQAAKNALSDAEDDPAAADETDDAADKSKITSNTKNQAKRMRQQKARVASNKTEVKRGNKKTGGRCCWY